MNSFIIRIDNGEKKLPSSYPNLDILLKNRLIDLFSSFFATVMFLEDVIVVAADRREEAVTSLQFWSTIHHLPGLRTPLNLFVHARRNNVY